MANLESLNVRLNLDTSRYGKGIKQAVSSTESFSKSVSRSGKEASGAASAIERSSSRMGRALEGVKEKSAGLHRSLAKLNGQTARMQARIDGVRGVMHRLTRVDEKMDNLEGRTARMGIAVAGGAAAGAALSTVASRADLLSGAFTALGRVKLPMIYAGLGGLPGLIAPVSTATLGLASALTQGAAGFAVIGGAAAAAGAGGLAIYAAAAKSAVSGAMLVREETREAANEQLKQQRVAILNTEATRNFNTQLDKSAIALTEVQAAIGDRVLPAFTRMIATWTGKLPELTPPLYELVDGITEVIEGLSRWAAKSAQLSQIKDILSFVAETGTLAAAGLANMVRAGLPIATALLPAATRFRDRVNEVVNSVTDWVRSSQGISTIEAVIAQLETRMYQVGDAVGALLKVAFNLGAAFAPLGGRILENITAAANALADATAKGSGFRREVAEWNAAAMPILGAAVDVAKELFTQFGRAAKAAMNLRMEGSDMSVLVAILNSIKDAAGSLMDSLVRSFEKLGPRIPELIEQFSRLFDTFTAQSPIIGRYVDLLTWMLKTFDSLPGPMKSAVVQVAAFQKVMGTAGMSITGAIGGLTTYVFHLSMLRAIQGKATLGAMALSKSTYANAAAWVRAKAVLVAQKVAMVASTAATWAQTAATWAGVTAQRALNTSTYAGAGAWIKNTASLVAHKVALVASKAATYTMAAAQRALNWAMRMNPIGLVITALAALAAGFIYAYKNSKTFRNIVNSVAAFLRNTLVGAFNLTKQVVKGAWNFIANLTRRVWNSGIVLTIRQNLSILKSMISAAFSVIKTTIVRVWDGIKTYFGGVWKVIKGIFTGNTDLIQKGLSQAWAGIEQVASAAWDGMKALFRIAWRGIVAIFRNSWETLESGLSSAWDAIKSVTTTVWEAISSFFTGWWNSLKNFVSDTAHAIWQRLKDSWNSVKTTATSIWNALGDWLRGWWNSARQFISDLAHQIWARLRDSWNSVKDTATNIWDSLGQWLRGWWDTALSFISDKAHSIWARLKDSWSAIKDTAKDLWRSIGDTIKGEINRLLRFIDTLGNAIEFIGGKIGFEVDIPDTKKLARGGTVAPKQMAAGGFMDGGTADRGGVGSGRRPVAITNEAGPEAVVPLSRRTPEGQRALEVANRSPNARSHRRAAPEGVPNTKAYAMGGVLGPGGLRYFYSGGATAMKNAVESRWPVTGSTYAGHPGGADSVDFAVTRWGARATGGAKQMGDEIAAYVAPPSTRWTIWYGQINEGGGWAPYRGGPTSGGSADPQTVAHTDHVHATAYSGGFKGGKGSGPSGGGSRFLSMLPSVPGFGDSGVLGDILSGAGNKLLSAAKDYVLEKANPFASGGIIPGPAGAPKLTFAEAGERVLPADLTASFDHLAASIDRWPRRASGGRAVAEGESTEKRNRERRMETLMQENNSRLERLERLVDESPERTGEAVDRAVQSNIAESRDYRDAMERAWESINSRNTLAGRR